MEKEEKEKLVIKTIDKIKPYLQADGGDVEFSRLEDDIVYVKVHGACIGCGALEMTRYFDTCKSIKCSKVA